MSKVFKYTKKVRFAHTDPAGIVFYPRYFEMVNETIEEWFETVGFPFAEMHMEQKFGVPLVHIEADFSRPGRIGDELEFCLKILKVGGASFELEITAARKGEDCFKVRGVLAYMDLEQEKSAPLPDDLRAILEAWKG